MPYIQGLSAAPEPVTDDEIKNSLDNRSKGIVNQMQEHENGILSGLKTRLGSSRNRIAEPSAQSSDPVVVERLNLFDRALEDIKSMKNNSHQSKALVQIGKQLTSLHPDSARTSRFKEVMSVVETLPKEQQAAPLSVLAEQIHALRFSSSEDRRETRNRLDSLTPDPDSP